MAGTNAQLSALSLGPSFQGRVSASIYKKALAIIEDVLVHTNLNYTAAQNTRALTICSQAGVARYFYPLACSTNVIASNFSVVNGETVSDITDAALDSQVYTVVFVDLV